MADGGEDDGVHATLEGIDAAFVESAEGLQDAAWAAMGLPAEDASERALPSRPSLRERARRTWCQCCRRKGQGLSAPIKLTSTGDAGTSDWLYLSHQAAVAYRDHNHPREITVENDGDDMPQIIFRKHSWWRTNPGSHRLCGPRDDGDFKKYGASRALERGGRCASAAERMRPAVGAPAPSSAPMPRPTSPTSCAGSGTVLYFKFLRFGIVLYSLLSLIFMAHLYIYSSADTAGDEGDSSMADMLAFYTAGNLGGAKPICVSAFESDLTGTSEGLTRITRARDNVTLVMNMSLMSATLLLDGHEYVEISDVPLLPPVLSIACPAGHRVERVAAAFGQVRGFCGCPVEQSQGSDGTCPPAYPELGDVRPVSIPNGGVGAGDRGQTPLLSWEDGPCCASQRIAGKPDFGALDIAYFDEQAAPCRANSHTINAIVRSKCLSQNACNFTVDRFAMASWRPQDANLTSCGYAPLNTDGSCSYNMSLAGSLSTCTRRYDYPYTRVPDPFVPGAPQMYARRRTAGAQLYVTAFCYAELLVASDTPPLTREAAHSRIVGFDVLGMLIMLLGA